MNPREIDKNVIDDVMVKLRELGILTFQEENSNGEEGYIVKLTPKGISFRAFAKWNGTGFSQQIYDEFMKTYKE